MVFIQILLIIKQIDGDFKKNTYYCTNENKEL